MPVKSLNLKSKNTIIFISILSLGLLLRILWVVTVNTVPRSDFLNYHQGALSIVNGNGYRLYGYLSAFEPIGYPGFLAILYFLFAPNILVAKIANILLSLLTMIVTYQFAKKAFSEKAALITLLLMALIPRNITYTSVLSTEIFFTALFLLLNYLTLKNNKKPLLLIVQGLLMGVLALTKPYMLAFPVMLLVVSYVSSWNLKTSIKSFAIICIVMSMVITPWTVRNFMVFGKFIPISTNGGFVLYANSSPKANGRYQNPLKDKESPLMQYKHAGDEAWDEVSVDKVGKQLAVKWIVSHPVKYALFGFKRLASTFLNGNDVFWATNSLADNQAFKYDGVLTAAAWLFHVIMMLLSAAYLFMVIKRGFALKSIAYRDIIILSNLVFISAIVFVFEGQPRYSFPLVPFFAMMAAYMVETLSAHPSK